MSAFWRIDFVNLWRTDGVSLKTDTLVPDKKGGVGAPPLSSLSSGICPLASYPGKIRDLIGGRADASQQRQAVGAHGLVLIIHENAFKE